MQNHPHQRIKVLEEALSTAVEYLRKLPKSPATRELAIQLEAVVQEKTPAPRAWVGDLVMPSGIPLLHAEVVDHTLWLSSDVSAPFDAALIERLRMRDTIFDLYLQSPDARLSELELALLRYT